jgi:hypothetical protein
MDEQTATNKIICTTLCLSIQQINILNKVQYSADGDVGEVIWSHTMAEIAKP